MGTRYDCALAPDKMEIKEKMFPKHQLMIVDFCNIPIDNAKKLVSIFFWLKRFVLYHGNLQFYLKSQTEI